LTPFFHAATAMEENKDPDCRSLEFTWKNPGAELGISLSDTGSLIAPTSKTGQTESPSAALDDKRVKLVKNRTECELRVGLSRFKVKERWKIDKNASTGLDRDGHTQPRSDDYNFSEKDHGYQYHKLDLVKQEIRLLVLDSAQDWEIWHILFAGACAVARVRSIYRIIVSLGK
jgi:hypothetical protein